MLRPEGLQKSDLLFSSTCTHTLIIWSLHLAPIPCKSYFDLPGARVFLYLVYLPQGAMSSRKVVLNLVYKHILHLLSSFCLPSVLDAGTQWCPPVGQKLGG